VTHTERETEIKRIAAKISQVPSGEHSVYLYSIQIDKAGSSRTINLFFEIHLGKQKTGDLKKRFLGVSHSDSLWHCILDWETFCQQFYATSSKTKLVIAQEQTLLAKEIQTCFSLEMVFVENVPDWDVPHYTSKLTVSRKILKMIREYLLTKAISVPESSISLSTGQVWGKYFDQPQKRPGLIRWKKDHTMLIDVSLPTPQRIWASSCLSANSLIVWGFYNAHGLQKLRLIPSDFELVELDSGLFLADKKWM